MDYFFLGDDLPLKMDEESFNCDKSVISTEDGSCSRSASTPAEEIWQENRGSLKKEVELEVDGVVQDSPSQFSKSSAVKRKIDKSDSSSNEPTENENIASYSALSSTQQNLLNADLLHSLQYFALLRQSFPNGN